MQPLRWRDKAVTSVGPTDEPGNQQGRPGAASSFRWRTSAQQGCHSGTLKVDSLGLLGELCARPLTAF
jgi:hypothetical protein